MDSHAEWKINPKWEVLSGELIGSGFKDHIEQYVQPRSLARYYHSGRAAMRETQEKKGPRTIYAFAFYFRFRAGGGSTGCWINHQHPALHALKTREELALFQQTLLEELQAKMFSKG